MAMEDQVVEILKRVNKEYTEEFANAAKQEILSKVFRLKQIMEEFQKMNKEQLLIDASLKKSDKLNKVVETAPSFNTLETGNPFLDKQIALNKAFILSENNQNKIVNLSFEGYELTMQILQALGFIDKVKMVFTHATKTLYSRAENLEIDYNRASDYFRLELRNGVLALRVKTKTMRATIMDSFNNSGQEHVNKIKEHYRGFIQPFIEYKGARTSKEGKQISWKPNWGVVSEAFERHWEMLQHSALEPDSMHEGDYGSVGDRWLLYRLSSGSDPFYTGPDTEFAQVKNTNASVLSNLDTLLKAITAIINLLSGDQLDQERLKEFQEAFSQKEPDIEKMTREIEEKYHENVSKELIEMLTKQKKSGIIQL